MSGSVCSLEYLNYTQSLLTDSWDECMWAGWQCDFHVCAVAEAGALALEGHQRASCMDEFYLYINPHGGLSCHYLYLWPIGKGM